MANGYADQRSFIGAPALRVPFEAGTAHGVRLGPVAVPYIPGCERGRRSSIRSPLSCDQSETMARAKWNRPKPAARRRYAPQKCQHLPLSVAPRPFSHTQFDQIVSLPALLMPGAPFRAGAAHVVQ